MLRILYLSVIALLLANSLLAIEHTPVPPAVLEWYSDVFAVTNKLCKDIEANRDPKMLTQAFNAASLGFQEKRIALRRLQLAKQYPDLFAANPGELPEKTVSAEMQKVSLDFQALLQRYNAALSLIAKNTGDPGLSKAMGGFTKALQGTE